MLHYPEIAVTPADVTGIPTNPMYERLEKLVTPQEMVALFDLRAAHEVAVSNVESAKGNSSSDVSEKKEKAKQAFKAYQKAIRDLTDKYPKAEPLRSRDDINIKPTRMGSMPIILANSVNLGLRGVMAGARYGATGTVMQERDIGSMDRKLTHYARAMKEAHPTERQFCALTPDHTVGDYWYHIQKYEDDDAVVVEGNREIFSRGGKFLGMVGPNEIRKAKGRNEVRIRDILKPANSVVTADSGMDPRSAISLMDKTGTNFLPFLRGDQVTGVTSKKSSAFHLRFPPHMNPRGGLAYLVGLRHDWKNLGKIEEWIATQKVGIGFKIDRAHLDRGTDPFRFIAAVRKLIDRLDPTLELHAGNVASGDGALRAADAGATGVWTGIGPSPVCITRVVSNNGVPQVTAMENVATALDNHGYDDVLKVSDGGVTDEPGQSVAVIRAGADMIAGSTGASKTRESSPEIEGFADEDKSKRRIWVSGNASEVVQLDSRPRDGETDNEMYRRVWGPRKEGDTRKVQMHPRYETIPQYLGYITDGLTSGVSFAGGDSNAELTEYGEAYQQTSAGQAEGRSRLQG